VARSSYDIAIALALGIAAAGTLLLASCLSGREFPSRSILSMLGDLGLLFVVIDGTDPSYRGRIRDA